MVTPEERSVLQALEFTLLFHLVDTNALLARVLFIGNKDGKNIDLSHNRRERNGQDEKKEAERERRRRDYIEFGFLLSQHLEEVGEHGDVTETVGDTATPQLVAFNSELERVLGPDLCKEQRKNEAR
jgi:hypothetical protein